MRSAGPYSPPVAISSNSEESDGEKHRHRIQPGSACSEETTSSDCEENRPINEEFVGIVSDDRFEKLSIWPVGIRIDVSKKLLPCISYSKPAEWFEPRAVPAEEFSVATSYLPA